MATKKTGTAAAEAPEQSTGEPSPIWDVLQALKEPVPAERLQQREGWKRGDGSVQMIDYIEWHTACDILDENFPEWTHSIKEVSVVADVVYCIVALTIAGITREGLGCGMLSRGETGFKKAEHDALKRAAVKFGVARDLYHKGEGQSEAYAGQGGGNYGGGNNGGQRQWTNERPADPFLRDPKDAPSSGQEKAMFAISKALGYDQDAFAAQLYEGCTSVKQLNRKAASFMIDQLNTLQNPPQQAAPPPPTAGVPPLPPPQGVPTHTGMPPVPPAPLAAVPPPPQGASTAQGQMAHINTVNSLKILCQKKGVDPTAIASQYSAGRATKPEEMSQPECVAAHDAVAAM